MNKGLEALEKIIQYNDLKNPVRGQTELIDTIETELKALEIIKSKEILSVLEESGRYYLVANMTGIEITKEEYELLKEALL